MRKCIISTHNCLTFLQQAIQENHDWERKRKRAHVASLLKKPEEEEEKEVMADIAIEAAAIAAIRRENIIAVREKREGGESLSNFVLCCTGDEEIIRAWN